MGRPPRELVTVAAPFARHPLVDSDDLAGKLLAGYEAAFPELGRLWHSGP